jgi:hypothetical protein
MVTTEVTGQGIDGLAFTLRSGAAGQIKMIDGGFGTWYNGWTGGTADKDGLMDGLFEAGEIATSNGSVGGMPPVGDLNAWGGNGWATGVHPKGGLMYTDSAQRICWNVTSPPPPREICNNGNPNGDAATIFVENMGTLNPGDTVVIGLAGGEVSTAPGGQCSHSALGCEMTSDPLTIHVLPEPASALLLLVAVPFLRRRR